jgi:response regulator RpfG family c-di-GMP phosphodiesterase
MQTDQLKGKILLVDDDRNLLSACQRNLRGKFDVDIAEGGEAALAKIASGAAYAVVVADRQMPGMDGVQLLHKVRLQAPDTVRMMLTGNADMEAVIRLVNETNIFRFLTKPCPPDLLASALEDACRLHQLTIAEKELLNQTLSGSVKLLTDVLSMTESPAFSQAPALRDAVAQAAARLGVENAWELQLAVMLAPIGQVTVPPETLVRSRTGQALTETEQQMLARLPETAARLLTNIPRLQGVAKIVRYQNKGFDGSGYPADDIVGDAIPLGARLLKIIVDLLRLERGGASRNEAFNDLREHVGQYDPTLLRALRQASHDHAPVPAPGKIANLSVVIPARELGLGMTLRSNVETKDGTLIVPAGHRLNEMTLEKVRNFASVIGLKEPILIERRDPLA